jgi:hypothetical protein
MVDTTTTVVANNESIPIIESETLSSSLTSLNIHREDSQIEINNYYINYIDDPSVPSESKTLEMNKDNTSISIIDENSCRLEISQLPEEVSFDR